MFAALDTFHRVDISGWSLRPAGDGADGIQVFPVQDETKDAQSIGQVAGVAYTNDSRRYTHFLQYVPDANICLLAADPPDVHPT